MKRRPSDTRRQVELLLPALWDEDAVWGIQREELPDPQMPKAKANPAHGNTLAAMLADIKQAWRRCDIPNTERRVIVLHYGLDYTYEQVGRVLDVPKSTTIARGERAVGRVTAWLNGGTYIDDEEGGP